MAAATAWRTWPALGSSERCSIDANKASAQTALVSGRYLSSCMLSPLTGLPPALTTLEKTVAGRVGLTDELHQPAGCIFTAPVPPETYTLPLHDAHPIRRRRRQPT